MSTTTYATKAAKQSSMRGMLEHRDSTRTLEAKASTRARAAMRALKYATR